ncbi:hypothetical protein ACG83_00045 [Frankia sp. R43]|nr:hypothetical protein ACG83_00045 [Frankia sp. R43]
MGWNSSGGNTNQGGSSLWSGLVHGTNEQGEDVTASFGREGTSKEGQTLLTDGHVSQNDFYGSRDARGHDHYDGRGGGTDRGYYTGQGS